MQPKQAILKKQRNMVGVVPGFFSICVISQSFVPPTELLILQKEKKFEEIIAKSKNWKNIMKRKILERWGLILQFLSRSKSIYLDSNSFMFNIFNFDT
jgi:hypothetical protein